MSDSTQSAGVAPGDAYVGFGSAEVAYLLSRYEGSQVERTTKVMSLNENPPDQFVAAGASALLARGMLEVVGDRMDLIGPAQVAAYTMAATEHWTEVGFMADSDNAVDGAVILQAGDATALMYPRALGTWYMMLKSPELTTSESVLKLAEAFLAEHGEGAVFLSAQTQAWAATLFLRRRTDGQWELAKGDAPFWEAAGVESATLDQVRQALALILGDSGAAD